MITGFIHMLSFDDLIMEVHFFFLIPFLLPTSKDPALTRPPPETLHIA